MISRRALRYWKFVNVLNKSRPYPDLAEAAAANFLTYVSQEADRLIQKHLAKHYIQQDNST